MLRSDFLSGCCASIVAALAITGTCWATGLAPNPELAAEGAGTSVAVGGVGLSNPDRTGVMPIELNGPVQVAMLYWAGDGQLVGDQELLLDGVLYPGEIVGSEHVVDGDSIVYRADVTAQMQAVFNAGGAGAYNLVVSDPSPVDNLERLHGAGLLVLYTDQLDNQVYQITVFEGGDYAWAGFPQDGRGYTDPITFTYDPADGDRVADLVAIVAEATGPRPDRIDISDNPSLVDQLDSSDGPEWDSDMYAITVPANASSTTMEIVSPQPLWVSDSLLWAVSALRLPTGPETPCDCCEYGKLLSIRMQYTGEDCSATSHSQDPGKVSCSGDPAFEPLVHIVASDKENPNDPKAKVWFDGEVALNELFDIAAATAGDNTLKANTFICVSDLSGNLLQSIEFHTSCSQPLFLGDQFGSALLVECEGEHEPVPGDCCEYGKLRGLTIQYTGDDCSATTHAQDPEKVSCDGDLAFEPIVHIIVSDKENLNDPKAKVWFDGEVALGDLYTLDAANAGENTLKAKTFLFVYDLNDALLQSIELHTSCSQPLAVGNQFGSALLVDCVGEDEPVPGDCCEYGKLRGLTIQYTGDDCSATTHSQDPRKVSCDGDPAFQAMVHIIATDKHNPNDRKAKVWFDGEVALGDLYTLDAASAGENKLKARTFVFIYDLNDALLQSIEFHTSCSQPLAVGDQFGSALLVDCVGENEPIPGAFCTPGVKPQTLIMEYTGEDCSASSHSQDPRKVSCEGDPAFQAMVHIVATDKKNANDPKAKVWFDGLVPLATTFAIDAANAGENKLKAETHVRIYDLSDNLLQTLKFHTSCSQPLFQDDQFGSLILRDLIPE